VDDLAALAVAKACSSKDEITDAIGPETFSFRELVELIAQIIGVRRRIISVSPAVGYLAARLVGLALRDVFLTREEIAGLMQGLLCTDSPPAGSTRLSNWALSFADELGKRYSSELARRRDREMAYDSL
jgi:NADH dehydrogenase